MSGKTDSEAQGKAEDRREKLNSIFRLLVIGGGLVGLTSALPTALSIPGSADEFEKEAKKELVASSLSETKTETTGGTVIELSGAYTQADLDQRKQELFEAEKARDKFNLFASGGVGLLFVALGTGGLISTNNRRKKQTPQPS